MLRSLCNTSLHLLALVRLKDLSSGGPEVIGLTTDTLTQTLTLTMRTRVCTGVTLAG